MLAKIQLELARTDMLLPGEMLGLISNEGKMYLKENVLHQA